MKLSCVSLLLGLLATQALAAQLDFGENTDQYQISDDPPESVGADSYLVVQKGDDSQIFIGRNLHKRIADTLNSCETKDNACFQRLQPLLGNAYLDRPENQDWKIEPRNPILALGLMVLAIAIAIPRLYGPGSDAAAFSVPAPIATSAAGLDWSDGVTLSADGTPVATVTQEATTTTIEVQFTPHIESVTEAHDNLDVGDYVITLGDDLARRLYNFITGNLQCPEGQEFDADHPQRRRARRGTYGGAICSFTGVLRNAQPNGPLGDMLYLTTADQFHLRLDAANIEPVVRDAMRELIDYARAFGEPSLALFNILWPIIREVVRSDQVVEAIYTVKADQIESPTSNAPSQTSGACPEKTSIACGVDKEDCPMVMKKEEHKVVCGKPNEGQKDMEDCECSGGAIGSLQDMDEEIYGYLQRVLNLAAEMGGSGEASEPICGETRTEIPTKMFDPSGIHPWGDFCKRWNEGESSRAQVGAKGGKMSVRNGMNEPELRKLRKRAGFNPDSPGYMDYMYQLKFERATDGGACALDCEGAFEKLGVCEYSNGGNFIYNSGSIDVGCGVFSYDLTNPFKDPERHAKLEKKEEIDKDKCYDNSRAQSDVKGAEKFAMDSTAKFCNPTGDGGMTSTWNNVEGIQVENYVDGGTGLNYTYAVQWIDQCVHEDDGPRIVDARDPFVPFDNYQRGDRSGSQDNVDGNQVARNWCSHYLQKLYTDCVGEEGNDGRGGSVDVGCVRYQWTAVPDRPLS